MRGWGALGLVVAVARGVPAASLDAIRGEYLAVHHDLAHGDHGPRRFDAPATRALVERSWVATGEWAVAYLAAHRDAVPEEVAAAVNRALNADASGDAENYTLTAATLRFGDDDHAVYLLALDLMNHQADVVEDEREQHATRWLGISLEPGAEPDVVYSAPDAPRGRLVALPSTRSGHPRFYAWSANPAFFAHEESANIGIFEWDGKSVHTLFDEQCYSAPWDARDVRVVGDLLEFEGRGCLENLQTDYSSGETLKTVHRVRLTPEGVQDLGIEYGFWELPILDDVLARRPNASRIATAEVVRDTEKFFATSAEPELVLFSGFRLAGGGVLLSWDSGQQFLYRVLGDARNPRVTAVRIHDADRWDCGDVVGTPRGRSIDALAADRRTGIVYAGTVHNVLQSSDGVSWSPALSGRHVHQVTALAVAADPSGSVYVGSPFGMTREATAGDRQERARRDLTALAVGTGVPGTVYAATGGAVATSHDGFETWTEAKLEGVRRVFGLAVEPATHGAVYAATDAGVFKSSDAAETWRPATRGLARSVVLSVAVSPGDPATVYVGTFGEGVYRSTDGGATWTGVSSGLTNRAVFALAIEGATIYAGTEAGLFRSTNAGRRWTLVETDPARPAVYSLAALPGTIFIGTLGDGVLRAKDP